MMIKEIIKAVIVGIILKVIWILVKKGKNKWNERINYKLAIERFETVKKINEYNRMRREMDKGKKKTMFKF